MLGAKPHVSTAECVAGYDWVLQRHSTDRIRRYLVVLVLHSSASAVWPDKSGTNTAPGVTSRVDRQSHEGT